VEFDAEWKVDATIKSVMNTFENDRPFLRHSSHLAPFFTALQRDLPSFRRGSLSEYWSRFLCYFIAAGPAPCELPVFQLFWRDLLSLESGRKLLVLEEISEFLFGLRSVVPRITLTNFLPAEYFVDNAAIAFWTEP
jgi:hypothetical protein